MLPNHRWLDRIVRGRAWIPLLGVLLVAIVGLRVEVLKLGSSVGRDIQAASMLQSSNQTLRSRVSELSGNQRIEDLAMNMGMRMPGPMDVHFVQAATAKHVAAAIRGIQEPASSTFLSGLATEREADGTDAVAAASTSAIGAQSTDDPGTVINTSPTDPTSTDVPTTGSTTDSTAGSTTGSTDTSTGGTTAVSDTSGTTATGGTTATSGTTDTSGTATSGTTDISGTTATSDTSGTQSSTGAVTSTGDATSAGDTAGGSTPPSTTGGSSLAG